MHDPLVKGPPCPPLHHRTRFALVYYLNMYTAKLYIWKSKELTETVPLAISRSIITGWSYRGRLMIPPNRSVDFEGESPDDIRKKVWKYITQTIQPFDPKDVVDGTQPIEEELEVHV